MTLNTLGNRTFVDLLKIDIYHEFKINELDKPSIKEILIELLAVMHVIVNQTLQT